ncbi:hypothetical protein DC522_04140 [Microvirga sp. KLBC 81]|uniref:DUF2336 domain-containing protein n=1 Tax=Microvirga sp. KLBC 81 TaxID=1862707 RepID=UPI000D51A83C|nr:DUF2336 domain-containing protein [Microvirga sp. KLBC 81]PVE25524.1 hypothetical protein DC522_04140 [Microvirga sp. KLBC 81]
MASSANPGLWSDLSDLSGADACAALLKVNADMFVAAPARDRESIETFEALALGFLPKADRTTLREIARILAPCPDTPPSVLDYLLQHVPEARGVILRHQSPPASLPDAMYLATPAGRVHLASQPHLDIATIERILVLREETSEDILATNPAFPSSATAFHQLVRRAIKRPALARILLQRTDLTAAHEACLYLAADGQRRRLIRERVAQTLAPATSPSFRLAEHDVAAFLGAAKDGDIARFERMLSEAFGFPVPAEWRILQIGRHLLLALALKALGFSEKVATRIFLTLHPALSYPLSTIRDLVREKRETSSAVALALVETILGMRALPGDSRKT